MSSIRVTFMTRVVILFRLESDTISPFRDCSHIAKATAIVILRYKSSAMNIKILGTGCPKCKQTESVVRQAIAETAVDSTVEKVEDIEKIIEYNVLTTPAVVIDGRVVIKGRVPTLAELKTLLTTN